MEILILVLLAFAVLLIALGAKRGAEAAQREREQRWGGLSGALPESSFRPDGLQTVGGVRGVADPGAGPRLQPPEPASTGGPASSSGGGSRRPLLRAFRRSDDESPRSPNQHGAVDVGARPSGRTVAQASRSDVARRGADSAAQNASATAGAARSTASSALRRRPPPVDINTAPVDELQSLPGVGIRAAERIVAYRERNGAFVSVDDLAAVEGFDQHRVSRLSLRATV
jgi:competence ComEA-like helix-hairpin-helix protein